MKTLRDIIDYVQKDLILCDIISCEEGCPKFNWCYIDSYLLSLDYLYKSQF